jgi:chromate reductase, NAD(P)H dehydrogenase (quinone)
MAMKYILVGTNRAGSRTKAVAETVLKIYQDLGESEIELLDLATVPLTFKSQQVYDGPFDGPLQAAIDKINKADAIVVVCPEYNGSFPGALKFFIDHWSFPESFEFRPIVFIGLGGRYGGLRPVEHLQQVFGYRNAFMYPQRVFLFNVWDQLKNGGLSKEHLDLLKEQSKGFLDFIRALRTAGLDANSRRK